MALFSSMHKLVYQKLLATYEIVDKHDDYVHLAMNYPRMVVWF